jgi:hypothetical protein
MNPEHKGEDTAHDRVDKILLLHLFHPMQDEICPERKEDNIPDEGIGIGHGRVDMLQEGHKVNLEL